MRSLGLLAVASAVALAGCSSGPTTPPHPASSTTAPSLSADLARAQGLMFANRYGDAASEYSQLMRRAPQNGALHAADALLLNYEHQFDAAVAEARQAATSAPKDARVAAILCRVEDWSGRLSDAVTAGRLAISLDATDPLAHLFLSEALADSGAGDQSRAELGAATPLVGTSNYLTAELHRERANLAHDQGDIPTYLAELGAARAAQPLWIYRTTELVQALILNNQRAAATAQLEAVIPLAPDDSGTLETLIGEAIADTDFAAALKLVPRAIAIDPGNGSLRDAAAEVTLSQAGDRDGARAQLDAALRDDPTDLRAAAMLLNMARDLGGDEAAARAEITADVAAANSATRTSHAVPDPDAAAAKAAQTALQAVNTARAGAGLPPVALDARLGRSAAAHAYYWLFNNASPSVVGLGIHAETPGAPGFRGVFPWTRAQAAGWPDSHIGEDITHRGDPAGAVDDWVNSVYHRFPIMRRDLSAIGFAQATFASLDIEDMEFGFDAPPGGPPVAYPGDLATAVPISFFDNELPDPVPAGAPRTTGYPVTVNFAEGHSVQLGSFTLTGPQGAVAAYLLPPGPSTENSASLLPRAPLKTSTRYTAQLRAIENGIAVQLDWSFTTASP